MDARPHHRPDALEGWFSMPRTAPLSSPGSLPERVPPDGSAEELAQRLFARAPASETEGLGEAERQRLVELALAKLMRRAPGQHIIHVGTGEGDAGGRHMPVLLLTDDMPFLVDSASAAIGTAGLTINRLLHPILPVARDADGWLTGIGGAAMPRESLILMEVERAPARQRAVLAATLDAVYGDVRAAVSDWGAMLAEVRAAARALDANPPPIAPHVLAETIAFLDWMAADNFTLLGAARGDARLGLFADPTRWPVPTLPDGDEAIAILKSDRVSTVHRPAPFDLVGVRMFNGAGCVEGQAIFAGLFTSAALNESPRRVPLVRRKVAEVVEQLGHDPRSHAGKALAHVIETFPREELFQVDSGRLATMAEGLLSLLDRPRPRLFARTHAGMTSILAYIPREVYSAELRERIGAMIEKATGGRVDRFEVELRAEGLARVHYVVRATTQTPDEEALDAALTQLTRGFEDRLEQALVDRVGPARAARLAITHGRAFSGGYREEFTTEEAAEDICRLVRLSTPADRDVAVYRRPDDEPSCIRLKVYRLREIIPLSESVPVLEDFGFRVIEEVPYDLAGGKLGWVHDFKLELPQPPEDFERFASLLEPALDAVFTGIQEGDAFNALIPAAGLTAREADWFRALFRYLRQTGTSYSIQTVVDVLRRNSAVTRALVELLRARHEPDSPLDAAAVAADVDARLDAVMGIDDDRILRLFKGVIDATLRTNAFVPGRPEALAFKFDSAAVPGLPRPRPWREIWVHSRRVEGIHLRGGPIARGGLRWSDRRDDFRTEVLGLVKAQMVKNAVIVPTGAKGGFYPKLLPDPAADREAWAAEGRGAYEVFIRALLSVTDNLDADGQVIPPSGVLRHDGDDPYLVVAADKGTATFSDTANALAEEAGFWLADAFASGGSAGYDHKAMGITARGAWVSVRRHFAEMAIDIQSQPVTVAGVGDMSGDVFGNGMLLSKTLKLVAAFDHRHIFLDPDPDPLASWKERQRLFALPRSSWADYDRRRISKGGGVFPRTQKAIPLSDEVRALLGVEDAQMAPSDLISAILKAPVDLLWFGGIGTYVKSAGETHADVGDRANDALRVDAPDVRARVIGEGANLGVTQAGRIGYARRGGRINTDFIDNSAGVDTSDHEVNIKIALGQAERAGRLSREERNRLLADMTEAVADLVLANNAAQTLALSIAEASSGPKFDDHLRLMSLLEDAGRLYRAVEGLPDAREAAERRRQGLGLTRPELAILLSHAKMHLKEELVRSPVVDDALLEDDLRAAFPEIMRERFADEILGHRLRREIVATKLANLLVNRGGLTLAHDLASELGCRLSVVAAAFVSARTLFDLNGLWLAIDRAQVPEAQALALHAHAADVVRVLVGDLARRTGAAEPARLSRRLAPGLKRLVPMVDRLLRPEPRAQVDAVRAELKQNGAPPDVVDWIATLHALAGAAGVVALASDLSLDEAATARAYTELGEALGIDWARGATQGLSAGDGWERLLAAATARSFETMRLQLIRRVTPERGDPEAAVAGWLDANRDRASALARAIDAARRSGPPTLAMLAHLASQARVALSD